MNDNNNGSNDNQDGIAIGQKKMKNNCDFESNLDIYKNTLLQHLG